MSQEIERKFLVLNDSFKADVLGIVFRQGYFPTTGDATVRVRIAGQQAWLTVKGPTTGLSRSEFEYEIPFSEAQEMLSTLCAQPLIEKTRYKVLVDGKSWEVDEFMGDNQGLTVAEIELGDENETFTKPDWLGEEVSQDPRYRNANLQTHPFKTWK